MRSILLKTFVRALLIFIPVAYLSFGQSSSLGNAGLTVLFLLFLALGLAFLARRVVLSKELENEKLIKAQSTNGKGQ